VITRHGVSGDPDHVRNWGLYTLPSGSSSWEATPTPIVRDSASARWYVNTAESTGGGTHAAMVALRSRTGSYYWFDRDTIYYVKLTADGRWETAAGVEITPTVEAGYPIDAYDPVEYGPHEWDLIQAGAAVFEPGIPDDEHQNQIVVREDPSGDPGILFLSGQDDEYSWRFARWDSANTTWTHSPIAPTDQFFDAGTFEFRSEDDISAYLTCGGGSTPLDPATNRGGTVKRYDSDDGGQSWYEVATIREAFPTYGERFGDPQLVEGDAREEARLLFCQWDNAGVNFVHKLFLASDTGAMMQKTVTPEFTRVSGPDRVETAIEVSQESFPLGADYVVLASAMDFPDALAGVPLAYAHNAPILLVPSQGVTPALAEELGRLRISGWSGADSGVILLGGTAALPGSVVDEVAQALYDGPLNDSSGGGHKWSVSTYRNKVSRIGGANRYATARMIADRLATRRGEASQAAVMASGESFADALSISPVAAVRGWPILLTPRERLAPESLDYIADEFVTRTIIVGGSAVVTDTAEAQLPGAERHAGINRYKTAYRIAVFGADEGLRRERLVIASGEDFPDALSGGVLAARSRAPVLVTPPELSDAGNLDSGLEIIVGTSASRALEWYVLGGEKAVSREVAVSISAYLSGSAP
jgi:putative cell wall-binding protein